MKISKAMYIAVLSSIIVGGAGVYSFAQGNQDFNAKVITVANSVSYLTIDARNSDAKIKNLYLDGEKTDFTKVSNDGKIIKTEFNGKHKMATIELDNGKKLEKNILGIYNKFPYKVSGSVKAPEIVWGHVTIPVTDFHTVARDSSGREVKSPESTLIDVKEAPKAIDVVATATPKKSNDIERLDLENYMFDEGEDLNIIFDLSKKSDRNRFKRVIGVNIYDGNKTVHSRIKYRKDANAEKGVITIPKEILGELQYDKYYRLNIKLRGMRSSKINIQKKHKSKPEVNPNPTEELSENTVDYGKDIEIKYNLNNKDEKNKYNRIIRVVKVYEDSHSERLSISKSKDGDTGIVRISFANSRPLQKRGPVSIKIIYRGMRPEHKEYILKDKAPEIQFNSNNGDYKVAKSLLFTLDGFEYLFQQDTGVEAIYINGARVTRKYVPNDDENIETLRAEGRDVAENESENGFYVVGNLLRIKGHAKELLHPGINYLTVKYKTFHDSNLKFVLEGEQENKPQESHRRTRRAARVDVISSATTGGVSKASVGSGSDSGGGTINMGAELVYDFDMVANASIVEGLGYNNPEAKEIMNYWEGTAKEVAAFRNNPNRKVNWDSYMNYVQKNRLNNGQYKSFIEYYNNPEVVLTKNSPYQVKYVLKNGIGLPIFNIGEVFNLPEEERNVPKSVLQSIDNVDVRDNIVLDLNSWTNAIEKITLNGYTLKPGTDYKVDSSNNKLTIYGKLFKNKGSYALSIKSRGFSELKKTILVKAERNIDTAVRIRTEQQYQNKLFTGENVKFEIMDPQARVTGAVLRYNDKTVKDMENNDGYTYIRNLGQLDVNGNLIKDPGKYSIRFYFAGRHYEDISFDVVGKSLEYIKAPIKNNSDIRVSGNKYSFTIENFRGIREVSSWMDAITSVEINGAEGKKVSPDSGRNVDSENGVYYVKRNKDTNFDAEGKLFIDSKFEKSIESDGKVKIVVKAKDYANVVLEYNLKDMVPKEGRDVKLTQVDPKTGETVNDQYIKGEYLDREETTLVPPFDEEEMNNRYPGMRFDIANGRLTNDGSYKDFNKLLNNIKLVEVNGERIHFGSTGMYIFSGGRGNSLVLQFMKYKFKPGDVISIYSNGYSELQYMVR